jgi:hypothetical protein
MCLTWKTLLRFCVRFKVDEKLETVFIGGRGNGG